jgi:DNA topoisomerase-1
VSDISRRIVARLKAAGEGSVPVSVQQDGPESSPLMGSFTVEFQGPPEERTGEKLARQIVARFLSSQTADDLLLDMMLLGDMFSGHFASRIAAKYQEKVKTEAGNTVYTYSERQIANRNKKKAERIEKLRKSVHKLRAKVKKDLHSQDPEKTLLALAVGLMDHTAERVGNDESAKDGHFGVTGWQKKHVSFGGKGATITYVGKSGVKHSKKVTDPALKEALKNAYDAVEGDDTQVLSWDGGKVSAEAINKYLAAFDITAKDIRGLRANTEILERLKAERKKGGKLPDDKKKRAKQLKEEFLSALDDTAEVIGHEASTLRSQYLVPSLEERYLQDGEVIEDLSD